MNADTHVAPSPAPLPSEFGLLAQLAFASRASASHQAHAARQLAFLSPDVLDMDLSDPMQRDFGDYELLEKIGQGGMGMVYRARQHSLQREVALKLLAAGPWASRNFIERFRREAQSAARLEHPNIVTVYEAGTQHDLHYFSMRLVRGESLAARIQRDGRLAPRDAARLMLTVAEAVDYAHRLGVLHLDLKPGNVLIDEVGEPMVADFGLARRIDEALADEGEDVSGTPAYMAPEQATARSQQIGRATDIYGLGAVLYELLTGRPPFLGATAQATLERVVSEAVTPPRELDSAIPQDLEAICVKCLAKDPTQRYPTAAALRDDLRRYLEDRPVSVREPGRVERLRAWLRREPRVAASVAAFVLALLIGLGVSAQQWLRAEASATASRALVWEGRRAAALGLQQAGKGHEALSLLIDNLREAETSGAVDDARREQRRIGMMLGQGATLIDRLAIDDANPFALELSPDGGVLAIAFNDLSVRWYDSATLNERGRVSLKDRLSSSGTPRLPALLRFVDARYLRVTLQWYSNMSNPGDMDTWLVDLDAVALVEPPADFADFSDATYSADGRHALLRNRQGQVQWWQVSPWRPLSGLHPGGPLTLPWMLGPQGAFALRFVGRMSQLEFLSLPDWQSVKRLNLVQETGISSWALSRDGHTLALGDFEGRVFLLDLTTFTLRTLPTSRGREILWVTFSEDDAWVASAGFDGTVYAFDVASGDALHAGQIRHDFIVRRIGLSHAQRMLIVNGDGEIALWRLARPGPRAIAAQRVGLGPARHGLAAQYAVGWSLDTGLLASAGIDGQVRLWRLPISPTLPARTPRQVPDRLSFDGHRLIDAEWDHLRLIDPLGRPLGDWRRYPQPPGFAELVDHGRLLLTTVGPELRFEDAVTGRALAAPQALPDSPARMLPSLDGKRVLLSFGGHGELGFEERLRVFDTQHGLALPGNLALAAPMQRYVWSVDGERLLAVGPSHGSTTVINAKDLSVVAEYPHDPFEPVVWGDFADDGTVVLVTRAPDTRQGSDLLRRWDPIKDEICGEVAVPRAQPLGAIAIGTEGFVAGQVHDLAVNAAGVARAVPRLAKSEPNAGMALDMERGLLARAHRHEVQLYDARTLEALGPPLAADITALDAISQVVFSPDGERLLARTWLGYWLQWSTTPDLRDATTLTAALAPLRPETEDQLVLFKPGVSERRLLRSRDPGPWSPAATRPLAPVARLTESGGPVPVRSPDLPATMVDLTDHYDTGPDAARNFFFNILPAMSPIPLGRQRIGGIDYDLRGMIQVESREHLEQGRGDVRILECVELPATFAEAAHVLMSVSLPEPVARGELLGEFRWRYQDRSEALLPLRAGHELPSFSGEDSEVPLVFPANPTMAGTGLPDLPLSSARLINPHPERPLRCLGMVATHFERPLLLLGMTLEPPGADAHTDAVIASPVVSSKE